MVAKRLSGSTVSSNTLKKWLLSGHTNAASDREQAILSEFEGLMWVRHDMESPTNINPQYPYYWTTGARDQVWEVWMEPPSMGSEDVEKWVMRELVDGKGTWSLGIFPGTMHYESINWENILYSGVYRPQHP
jgi:hypothetical protein